LETIIIQGDEFKQVQSLNNLASLPPQAKAIVEFSKTLEISSQVEKQFWSIVQAQQAAVAKIFQGREAGSNQH
jgi:hypothetical protein